MASYREISREHITDGLNECQREAVDTLEGPLLVLAGAGTGKTTVITRRILNLIRSGVRPEQILALTFTKKAAQEMYERVSALVGRTPQGMTIGTFHSLGFRLLRQEGARLGLMSAPKLIDPLAQGDIAKRILAVVDPEGEFSDTRLLGGISRAKNHGQSPDALLERADSSSAEKFARGYKRYDEELRGLGLLDFDDMIALSIRLLRECELVREECRRRWPFILVDEYQDTSRDQNELVKLLLGPRQNLCAVGDDDQSIYRFRGAEVGNILAFGREFPRSKTVFLETNYRSSGEVVELANALIEGAKRRYPKRLTAAAGRQGVPVRLLHSATEEGERDAVADEIGCLVRAGVPLGDIAILHRARRGLALLAASLRDAHIPTRQSGAEEGKEASAVSLLTLHAAKGLEFTHVFMPGVEEGTLPHFNAVEEGEEAIEEERRLLYVGLTRAKRGLVLSASARRGSHDQCVSRFLDEPVVAERLVEVSS